jgi:hypothetical protein
MLLIGYLEVIKVRLKPDPTHEAGLTVRLKPDTTYEATV